MDFGHTTKIKQFVCYASFSVLLSLNTIPRISLCLSKKILSKSLIFYLLKTQDDLDYPGIILKTQDDLESSALKSLEHVLTEQLTHVYIKLEKLNPLMKTWKVNKRTLAGLFAYSCIHKT